MATKTEIQAEIDRREGLVHSPWFLIEEILDLKAEVEYIADEYEWCTCDASDYAKGILTKGSVE